MLMIVGFVVVIGSVLAGYLMEGGVMGVLSQPAEFIIIGGCAAGTLIVSTPATVLKEILAQVKKAMGGGQKKQDYIDLLSLLYQIFKQVQQSGVMSLEPHFEDASKSPILNKYPSFMARHEAVDFLADSVKIIIVGGIAAHDLEALMDEDLKVHHDMALKPATALTKVGDALPGLGIVAAVLGIIITMGHLDAGPEVIGHHVGAALVGTFLGILMCYGMLGPISTSIEMQATANTKYMQCIKDGMLAAARGSAPGIAVEFSRRAIFSDERPSIQELEQALQSAKG